MKHRVRTFTLAKRRDRRSGRTRRPLLRIHHIHEVIQAQRFPNCSTLAREIEVTPKTIQRDISYMRDEMNLPLEYHDRKHGYYYTRPVNEFPLLHLSRAELMALFLARKALEPVRGTRLERMLAESFSKIAEACPGEVSFHWHDLDEAFSVKAAGALPADVALFSDLVDAVMERREVAFDYHKLTAHGAERRQVRPHHVGQIEHGWYLIAFDPQRKAMRTFALQRMINLSVLKSRFERVGGFNAVDHLGGSFGVWSYEGDGCKPREVRIRFTGYAARVVAERRWHPTQEIEPLEGKGNAIEFRVRVAGLEEITRWILSWGGKAKVLAPEELEERVRREATEILEATRVGEPRPVRRANLGTSTQP